MHDVHFPAAVSFGRTLVESGDLDPVYIAIAGADLPLRQRKRLVLAYSCLYRLDVAGAMSEQAGDSFWHSLLHAAASKDVPRGTERRHWRGAASIASAEYLKSAGRTPEEVVDFWLDDGWTFADVSRRVQVMPGFGPWIAFKVADLAERVLGCPVDFSYSSIGVFKDPAQGANLLLTGDYTTQATPAEVEGVMICLIGATPLRKLVPRPGTRRFGRQEAETVLCKYKSHVKGHYPIGKDSREVSHVLEHPWRPSKTVNKLRNALHAGINWAIVGEHA